MIPRRLRRPISQAFSVSLLLSTAAIVFCVEPTSAATPEAALLLENSHASSAPLSRNTLYDEDDTGDHSYYAQLKRMQPLSPSSNRQLQSTFPVKCRMTIIDYLYATVEEEEASRNQILGCIPLNYDSEQELDLVLPTEFLDSQDLALVWQEHKHAIKHGTLLLHIDPVTLSEDFEELNILPGAQVSELVTTIAADSDNDTRKLVLTPPPPTVGSKSVYVVRVSTPDSAPTYSLDEITNRLFASNSPSFVSQYAACSMNQLTWTLAGGHDVMIDAPIASFSTGMQLVVLAESYLRQTLQVSSVSQLADRVLFCVAPGTTVGWIASASINHFRAIFNNDWCWSLSGTMHELGHTLGLLHSGEAGNKYGDQTGYMGYGSRSDSTPLKCFNGYHSWQMGWYASRTLAVDAVASPGRYNLAGLVEYPKLSNNDFVILIVDDTYFLQYNLATSFNVDTGEKRDQVTITVYTDANTDTLGGLSAGNAFMIDNYKNTGQTLVIQACSVRAAENAATAMVVAVGLGQSYCDVETTDAEAPPQVFPQCVGLHSGCAQHTDCCDSNRCLPSFVGEETICSACRPIQEQCTDSSECCDGLTCEADVCSDAVEQTPLAIEAAPEEVNEPEEAEPEDTTPRERPHRDSDGGCANDKMFCNSDANCCGSLRCIELKFKRCRQCRRQFQTCSETKDCCGNLMCFAGNCRDWFSRE